MKTTLLSGGRLFRYSINSDTSMLDSIIDSEGGDSVPLSEIGLFPGNFVTSLDSFAIYSDGQTSMIAVGRTPDSKAVKHVWCMFAILSSAH